MTIRTRFMRLGAGLTAATASSALAQTVELRNDSVPPMQGQIVPQWGFTDGEIGAATFVVPAHLYPLRIKRVRLMWFSLRGQSTNNIQDGIVIWNGRPGAGLQQVFESDPVQLIDGGLNEINLESENIVIPTPTANREITIGLVFAQGPNGDPQQATLCTDADGCQVARNQVRAVDFPCTCWIDPCTFFSPPISGDFIIRAMVERDTPPCYPDCDTSTGVGSLDIFDFLCFQNHYTNNDPYACECDTSTGPGQCDIFDFLCFQNAFDDGCP